MKHRFVSFSSYAYLFFFSLRFSEAFWVVYLRSRGFSFAVIGLMETVFHIASFLGEVPTGLLADRFGRKAGLIMGRLAAILSSLLMLTSQTIPSIMLAFVLSALSWTFHSGAFEAWVYDSLADHGQAHTFTQALGRFNALFLAGGSIAALLGGSVANTALSWLYILNIMGDTLAIIALIGMKEKNNAQKSGLSTPWQQLKESLSLCVKDRVLAKMLFIAGGIGAFVATSGFYGQSVLREGGAAFWIIGLTGTAANLIALFPAWASYRFEARWGNRRCILMGSGLIGLSLLALGVFSRSPSPARPLLLVLGILLQTASYEAIYPMIQNRLNRQIPSEQRATLLSAAGMVFSVIMMVLFPLFGWLSDFQGLSGSFLSLGLVLITAISIIALKHPWQRPDNDEGGD